MADLRRPPLAHAASWTIALLALGLVGARVWSPVAWQRIDHTALVLFGMAAVALLVPAVLPRLTRVKHGATEIEFGALESLPVAPRGREASPRAAGERAAVAEWTQVRDRLKDENRGIFLAHVIRPSHTPGQRYDVFIRLTGTRRARLQEVSLAEFYFGPAWSDRVFRVQPSGDEIGIRTSAHGPFVAVCRVTFSDGASTVLHRFIDFDMGRLFAEGTLATPEQ